MVDYVELPFSYYRFAGLPFWICQWASCNVTPHREFTQRGQLVRRAARAADNGIYAAVHMLIRGRPIKQVQLPILELPASPQKEQ